MTTRDDCLAAIDAHIARLLTSPGFGRHSAAGGPPPPMVPRPPPPPPPPPPSPVGPSAVAAFIIRSGRLARGEEPASQDGDIDDIEEGEGDGQRRGPQPSKPKPQPAPGQIILDIVEQQRKEREGT